MSNNTLSERYYQTKVNKFSEFILKITGTLRKLLQQYYILFQISSNTDIFQELLPNNTTHFSRHQAILTFSESYWQTILHNFPELTSNNNDIFTELLASNTTHFSRVYVKQYWHFQSIPSKLNCSKKNFQS